MGDSQFGQLGDGTTTTTATPRGVSPSRGEVVDQFAAGIDAFYTLPNGPNGMVTAALTTSGKVYGAGYNFNGELGDGTFIDRSTPVAFGLPAGEKATQIAVSGSGIKALTATGRVFGSGRNENGQLGNGSTIPRQYDPETYARLSSGESTPVEFQQPVGHRAMTLFNRQIASRGYGSENPYPYTFVVSCPRKLSVGDRVFNDANGNGTQDPGEETMTGVKVRLYLSGSDTPLAEDVTDANGSWLFDGLDPGTYVVEIVLPAGFENTVTTGTSGDPTNSTSNDNNGVTSNGITVRSKPLVLALGTAPTGEISGRTTKSLDADAFQTVAFGVYRKPAQTETPASVITPPAPLVAPKTPQEAPARVAIESTRLGAAKTASERRVFPGQQRVLYDRRQESWSPHGAGSEGM